MKIENQSKRQKAEAEPDIEFFERAYASVMCERVMSATAKQKKKNFDHSRFKRDVCAYYGAIKQLLDNKSSYCHLMG